MKSANKTVLILDENLQNEIANKTQTLYDMRVARDEGNVNTVCRNINKLADELKRLSINSKQITGLNVDIAPYFTDRKSGFSMDAAANIIYNFWRSNDDYKINVMREHALDAEIKWNLSKIIELKKAVDGYISTMDQFAINSMGSSYSNMKVNVDYGYALDDFMQKFVFAIGQDVSSSYDTQLAWRNKTIEDLQTAAKNIAKQLIAIENSYISTFNAAIAEGDIATCKAIMPAAQSILPELQLKQYKLIENNDHTSDFILKNYPLSHDVKAHLWQKAAAGDNPKIITDLLHTYKISKPNFSDAHDRHLIKLAWKNTDVLKALLGSMNISKEQSSFLYGRAVCDSNIKVIKLLGDLKIERPEYKDYELNLFHYAAKTGDLPTMKYLHEHDFEGIANISSHDTSLYWKVMMFFSGLTYPIKLFATLFGYEIKDEVCGKTPLHYAAASSYELYDYLSSLGKIPKDINDCNGAKAKDIFKQHKKLDDFHSTFSIELFDHDFPSSTIHVYDGCDHANVSLYNLDLYDPMERAKGVKDEIIARELRKQEEEYEKMQKEIAEKNKSNYNDSHSYHQDCLEPRQYLVTPSAPPDDDEGFIG